MIERYTPPEIGKIWSDDEKFKRFLRIEALLCNQIRGQTSKCEMINYPLKILKICSPKKHNKAHFFPSQVRSILEIFENPAKHYFPYSSRSSCHIIHIIYTMYFLILYAKYIHNQAFF